MALRRNLPSRMMTDTAPEGTNAPAKAADSAPKSKTHEAPAAPAVAESSVVSSEDAGAVFQSAAMAEAAMSAFGDLPQPQTPRRVLEDSFAVPALPAQMETFGSGDGDVAPRHEQASAWDGQIPSAAEPVPAEPEFVAPAWQQPAEVTTVAETVPAVAPAWEVPAESLAAAEPPLAAPYAVADVQQQADEPPAAVAAPIVTDFMPTSPEAGSAPDAGREPVQADVPQAVGLAAEVAAPDKEASAEGETDAQVPQGPAEFALNPSRPGQARIKRRVREKRARDFSAMGAPDDQKPKNQPVAMAFAPMVPVDDKPLDQVDEALIATGVMAPPPADSLTSSLPGGLAESMAPLADLEAPKPTPLAVPFAKTEAPLPELPTAADVQVPVQSMSQPVSAPSKAAQQPAMPKAEAAQPEQMPDRYGMPEERDAMPQPVMAPPSFTLSNTADEEEKPLPTPQSGLPWAQQSASAEWDIGDATPEIGGWQHAAPEMATEPAMHMPPQADLYKTLAGGAAAASGMPGGIPAATGKMAFTPELPGQRRKTQGTPWALVVVGVVVAAAAGAYVMTSGRQTGGAQLAQVNRAATGNDEQPLLPPPEQTGSSSFVPAQTPASTQGDAGSSALVAFADVPAEEAAQPIVADGSEEIPQGFVAQLQTAVDKARVRAENEEKAASAGAQAQTPAEQPAYTQDDLKKELEAYRNALAASADPADLKPATFDANESKGKTDAELASGALLPPPSATPPEELYTHNPNNLPVVAEPVVNAPERVRTLADFPEAADYVPAREKVEIPANIRPKMAATDFPALEVLSFVPGQGIVAYADGREGVLLIGESLDGWELVAVNGDSANFRTGRKTYQVTADN